MNESNGSAYDAVTTEDLEGREPTACERQSQRYARDLAQIYVLERRRNNELEIIREHRERLEREMRLASKLQNNLLPSIESLDSLAASGLDVAPFTSPAKPVNGDFYHVRRNGSTVLVAIGDCRGHGVSAGMLTMSVHALLDAFQNLASPVDVAAGLGDWLRRTAPSGEFVAMTLAGVDLETGKTTLAAAGLPFPVLHRFADGRTLEIEIAGPPLGVGGGLDEHGYAEFFLEPGDKLLLYTDGLGEAPSKDNGGGEFFAIPSGRLLRLVHKHGSEKPAGELLRSIISEWRSFHGGGVCDDCTLLVLERTR
jgi:serine phosphatase RsbU (regulator of sigma subunit)